MSKLLGKAFKAVTNIPNAVKGDGDRSFAERMSFGLVPGKNKPKPGPAEEDDGANSGPTEANYLGVSEEALNFKAPEQNMSPEALLENIDKVYFEEKMDEMNYLLDNLPTNEDFNPRWLDNQIDVLQSKLDAVIMTLSQRVLKSYSAFLKGMAQVEELEADLSVSTMLVKSARRGVGEAKDNAVDKPLDILRMHRQMSVLEAIVSIIHGFNKVIGDAHTFFALLDSAEYPRAIETLRLCNRQLKMYEKFPCLNGLKVQLMDGNSLIDSKMAETLEQMCHMFTPSNFDRLIRAYYTLGKTFTLEERLPKAFTSSLKTNMLEILFSWVMRSKGADHDPMKLKKMKFSDLVVHLSPEHLLDCLRHVFEVASDLLANHRSISNRLQFLRQEAKEPAEKKCLLEIRTKFMAARKGTWDKLQRRVIRIMRTADVTKLKQPTFLNILSLVQHFTAIGEAFCGMEATLMRDEINAKCKAHVKAFHRETMEKLREMLENESWAPFPLTENFNMKDIKELVSMKTAFTPLPTWTPPTEAQAAAAEAAANDALANGGEPPLEANGVSGSSSSGEKDPLARYMAGFNPFKVAKIDDHDDPLKANEEEEHDGDTLKTLARQSVDGDDNDDDDDKDVPEELKADFIDEDGEVYVSPPKKSKDRKNTAAGKAKVAVVPVATVPAASTSAAAGGKKPLPPLPPGKNKKPVPIVTTTSLHLVRAIGRYINLAEILNGIASLIIDNVKRLVDFYMYVVFSLFSRMPSNSLSYPPSRLRAVLWPISVALKNGDMRASLKWEHDTTMTGIVNTLTLQDNNDTGGPMLRLTNFSGNLSLSDVRSLYGLAQRAVGVESLNFIAHVLRFLRPRMESVLQPWEISALSQQFFGQTLGYGVPDLCSFVYESISKSLAKMEDLPDRSKEKVRLEDVPGKIAACRWDKKEMDTQTNAYVKQALDFYHLLGAYLDQLDFSTIPQAARLDIWRSAITVGMEAFIEGYSRVRKCTTEGRATMAVDLKNFQKGLEEITPVRPLPKLDLVDNYIKGYYIPENDIWEWIMVHQNDYTVSQLKGLVEVGVGQTMKKKAKQDLLDKIDELEQLNKRAITIHAYDTAPTEK